MWVIPIGWRYSKARVTPAATGTGWPGAQIPFQCVAASIGQATAHWLTSGPLVPAVMASCAVPGLLPPVEIGGGRYFDGGLVDSFPPRRIPFPVIPNVRG
jgi:hypothetical protein